MHKEIPDLKQEIERMNNEISLRNEELRYIRNDTIEMDKETMVLKDDIKKLNKTNTDLKVYISNIDLERKRYYTQRNKFIKKTYRNVKREN
jgi:hypothetical protein